MCPMDLHNYDEQEAGPRDEALPQAEQAQQLTSEHRDQQDFLPDGANFLQVVGTERVLEKGLD